VFLALLLFPLVLAAGMIWFGWQVFRAIGYLLLLIAATLAAAIKQLEQRSAEH